MKPLVNHLMNLILYTILRNMPTNLLRHTKSLKGHCVIMIFV